MSAVRMFHMRRRNQQGYVLPMVLVCLILFAFGGVAILAYTSTVSRASSGLAGYQANVREIDGVLERAVNEYRSNPNAVNHDCAATDFIDESSWSGGRTVTCSNTSYTAEQRVAVIEVIQGSVLLGRAKVKVFDTFNSAVVPGVSMDVCDWQMGKTLTMTVMSC